MLSACTCHTTSTDLAAIGDVLAKECNIFVIDKCDLLLAEAARLLLKLLV